MLKRIILGGVLGGVAVFFWGALSHMVLPIGMMGIKIAPEAAQQQVLTTTASHFNEPGVYLLPAPQPEIWKDDAAMTAFGTRAAQQPYAFVVYQPQGRDGMAHMGTNLLYQAIICILAGLLAAWIVSLMIAGFMQRTFAVTAMGAFGWLIVNASYWNWYRFPTEFTTGAFLDQVIGWFIGGLVIAALAGSRLDRGRI